MPGFGIRADPGHENGPATLGQGAKHRAHLVVCYLNLSSVTTIPHHYTRQESVAAEPAIGIDLVFTHTQDFCAEAGRWIVAVVDPAIFGNDRRSC